MTGEMTNPMNNILRLLKETRFSNVPTKRQLLYAYNLRKLSTSFFYFSSSGAISALDIQPRSYLQLP